MQENKEKRKKVLMIVNPRSGKRRPYFSAGKIAEMFAENDMELAVYYTAPDYNAEFLVKEHAADSDIIACCGGDGTISETISGLMDMNINKPVGYIPAGTTNDLARSLDIPTRSIKAAQAIISGDACPLDIGSFDSSYFVYIASFGAFTEVSYATSQKAKNLFGRLAYFFSAAKYMTKIRSHHLKVSTDKKRTEGDYIFGAITNSTSVAGLFKYKNNSVDFSDGKYEVLLIKKPRNIFSALGICSSMLRGTYKGKYIEFFHASELEISSDKPLDWSVDGEHKRGGKTVRIKNHPQAVRLLMKKELTE